MQRKPHQRLARGCDSHTTRVLRESPGNRGLWLMSILKTLRLFNGSYKGSTLEGRDQRRWPNTFPQHPPLLYPPGSADEITQHASPFAHEGVDQRSWPRMGHELLSLSSTSPFIWTDHGLRDRGFQIICLWFKITVILSVSIWPLATLFLGTVWNCQVEQASSSLIPREAV